MKRSPSRKGRPYAILAVVTAALAVTLLVAPGCGLQGEGQRCDRNVSATPNDPTTGNDDCDASLNLVCVSKTLLLGTSDICCPKGVASTNPNCQVGGGEGGGPSMSAAVTSAAVTSAAATTGATSTSAGTSTGAGGAGGGK